MICQLHGYKAIVRDMVQEGDVSPPAIPMETKIWLC